jgi:hypothetical protein
MAITMLYQPQDQCAISPRWKPAAVWNFATKSEALSRQVNVEGANSSRDLTQFGKGVKVQGTSNLDRLSCYAPKSAMDIGSGEFTVFCIFRLDSKSNTTASSLFGRWGTSVALSDWDFGGNWNSGGAIFQNIVGSTSYTAQVSITWTAGNHYAMFGRRSGTTIFIDLYDYKNATWYSSSFTNVNITTINWHDANTPIYAGTERTGASFNSDVTLYLASTFKRKLSNADILSLSANPYQVLKKEPINYSPLFSTAPQATVNISITDSRDTIAATAAGAATATPAITAPNDIIAATASGSATATVAITTLADTIAANASGSATATAAITSPNDTIAVAESQSSTATAAIIDLADTIAGNASGTAVINASITAPNDTIAASETGQATANIAITDSRDTIALSADMLSTVANNQAGRSKKRRRIINGINYEVTDAEAMALIQKFQDELSKPEKKVKRTKKTLEKTSTIDYPTDNQAITEQIKAKSIDIADIKPLTAQYDAIADQAMIRQMEAEYARMQKEIEDEIDDELALLMLL